MSVIQRNTRTIDLSAIENNMRAIRASVPPQAKVLAVVKADGYGHGAVETARAAIRKNASDSRNPGHLRKELRSGLHKTPSCFNEQGGQPCFRRTPWRDISRCA